jgi:hypothetical protein
MYPMWDLHQCLFPECDKIRLFEIKDKCTLWSGEDYLPPYKYFFYLFFQLSVGL